MSTEQIALITLLTTTLASVISIVVQQLIAWLLTRKKTNAETNKEIATTHQIDAGTDLSSAQLIELYQGITKRTGQENVELKKQLEELEDAHIKEKESFITEINNMRQEVNDLKNEFKTKFDLAQKENEQWKDWARRLALQLESWRIVPVPFDIEEAKRAGLSLGEIGPNKN
jgi:hypothetical protein